MDAARIIQKRASHTKFEEIQIMLNQQTTHPEFPEINRNKRVLWQK